MLPLKYGLVIKDIGSISIPKYENFNCVSSLRNWDMHSQIGLMLDLNLLVSSLVTQVTISGWMSMIVLRSAMTVP